MVRIICFDLDGTLVDETGHIHPNDVAILKNPPQGVVMIPASGRSLSSVKQVFARNGLFAGEKMPYPLILQNGSLIFNQGEEQLGYFPFPGDIQDALIRLAMDTPGITYLFMAEQTIHCMSPNPFGLYAVEKYDFQVDDFPARCNGIRYSKIMCISQDYSALQSIAQAYQQVDVAAVYSMPTIFEITPAQVNKGSGLTHYLQSTKTAYSSILAAGNDQNDLEMLELADQCFVPAGCKAIEMTRNPIVVDHSREGMLSVMIDQ